MKSKENQELVEWIKWIAENKVIWNCVCNTGLYELTYRDYIEMLEDLLRDEKYLFLMILIQKAIDNRYVYKTIVDTVVGKLENESECNVLTEYVEKLKSTILGDGGMDDPIMV